MATVVIASAIARWMTAAPTRSADVPVSVSGSTLQAALRDLFRQHPNIQGYIVDERGSIRHHVAVFINGLPITDKIHLGDPVPENAEVYIVQALSGGQ